MTAKISPVRGRSAASHENEEQTAPAAASAPPGSEDDAELVARVLARDEHACELLMRRHNQRLFRVARSIVGNATEVEDVLQDSYLKAFRSMDRFEGRAPLAAWLVRIVINTARSRVRRNSRIEGLESVSDDDGQLADRPAIHVATWRGETIREPERTAGSHELRGVLADAVDRLPEALRTVFVLRCVEGVSVAETAESLDLSHEVVRVRLHRARAALRAHLDRRLDQEALGLYEFGNERCDRLVAAVLARLHA